MNYHIGRLVLSSLCVGDLVRLVLSGAPLKTNSRAIQETFSEGGKVITAEIFESQTL
jgi:hypothetical protein